MTDEEFKTIAAAILRERAACARIARQEAEDMHAREARCRKAGSRSSAMQCFGGGQSAERIARAIERGEK
jgi:hypothetical protein